METTYIILLTTGIIFTLLAILFFYLDHQGYSVYHRTEIERKMLEALEASDTRIKALAYELEQTKQEKMKQIDKTDEVRQAYETWCKLIVKDSEMNCFYERYPTRNKVAVFYNNMLLDINKIVETS